MTQRSPRPSSLPDEKQTPTRTWHSPWAVAATQSQNDASLIDSPQSHHRPSIIRVPSLVRPIAGKPVMRWNVQKANWELFTAETERRTPGLPNPQADDADSTCTAYCNMRSEEEHPTRLQQTIHPRVGRQLQPPPSRAPTGHRQGRHRHNGDSTTPEAG